jgi:hypothetical protein
MIEESVLRRQEHELADQLEALWNLMQGYGHSPDFKLIRTNQALIFKTEKELLDAGWKNGERPELNRKAPQSNKRGRTPYHKFAVIIKVSGVHQLTWGQYISRNDHKSAYWNCRGLYRRPHQVWWKELDQISESEQKMFRS